MLGILVNTCTKWKRQHGTDIVNKRNPYGIDKKWSMLSQNQRTEWRKGTQRPCSPCTLGSVPMPSQRHRASKGQTQVLATDTELGQNANVVPKTEIEPGFCCCCCCIFFFNLKINIPMPQWILSESFECISAKSPIYLILFLSKR